MHVRTGWLDRVRTAGEMLPSLPIICPLFLQLQQSCRRLRHLVPTQQLLLPPSKAQRFCFFFFLSFFFSIQTRLAKHPPRGDRIENPAS